MDEFELREAAKVFYRELYAEYQTGGISYSDAMNKLPFPIFYFLTGTPGRIRFSLEQHAALATHDAVTPVRTVIIAWIG